MYLALEGTGEQNRDVVVFFPFEDMHDSGAL